MLGRMSEAQGSKQQPQSHPRADENTDENGLKPVSAKTRTVTIIATMIGLVVVFLALGFFVHWGLAAIFAIIMIPGAISMAIVARHPEKTGGSSMFGVSNPNTLLEPFTGKRK